MGQIYPHSSNNCNAVKNIIVASSLAALMILGSFGTTHNRNYRVNKIVIDAGHGGKDPGTSGQVSKEKDVALAIALELGGIINEYLRSQAPGQLGEDANKKYFQDLVEHRKKYF